MSKNLSTWFMDNPVYNFCVEMKHGTPHMTTYGAQGDYMQTGSGPEVDWKWTGSGPEVN